MDFPFYINNKYTNMLLEKYSIFQYKEHYFYHSTQYACDLLYSFIFCKFKI